MRLTRLAPALLALTLAACTDSADDPLAVFSEPDTKIAYEPRLEGAPSEEIEDLMEASLALFRREEDGAPSPAFLRRRAKSDVETAQKILRSRGYYEAKIEAEVTDAEGDAPATATLVIEPGRQFTLARQDLLLVDSGPSTPPALDAAAFGAPVGGPASAAGIVSAESGAVTELTHQGFPYAEFRTRDAVADLELATLEVESVIATGRQYSFGPLSFEGAPNVDGEYLLTYLPWNPGETFDQAKLLEYQRRLANTGLFNSVRVSPPEDPPAGEALPLTATMEEAPFRTVSASVRFSTADGPIVRGEFQHRNLFGANEQLRLTAEAGIEVQRFEVFYLKPQYLRPGQDLTLGLEIRHIDEDAYEELGLTATAGLQRKLSPILTVGAGVLGEVSQITDEGVEETAILAGLPAFADWDASNDKLDPTRGWRARLEATPFVGTLDSDFVSFLVLEATGSAYQPLDEDERFVLAGRARYGSILASDLDDVPPTRRFYSGGGGSIRAYATDFVGPLDGNNDPIGGLSVAEAALEMRAQVYGDIGVALFFEAGAVSTNQIIDLGEALQLGYGVGLRYKSPVGPIRLDVALPVDPRSADDDFQIYFSIGQAF